MDPFWNKLMIGMEASIGQMRKRGNDEKSKYNKARLISDLEEAKKEVVRSQHDRLDDMIEDAKAGYYSDFDSPDELCITTLVDQLTKLGLPQLAEKAKKGKYDHSFRD